MDTKLVGDIAVQHAILAALERGWGVCVPVGDRAPYDLVFDVDGKLRRVQVKSAYMSKGYGGRSAYWTAHVTRCKTNRRVYKFERYRPTDFDIALIWHPRDRVFFVIPIKNFLKWRGTCLTLARTGRGGSFRFRDAWQLFE